MGQIAEQDKLEEDLKNKGLTFYPGGQLKGMIGHLTRGDDETVIEIYEHAFYVQNWHYAITPEIVELINRIKQWYPIEKVTRFY